MLCGFYDSIDSFFIEQGKSVVHRKMQLPSVIMFSSSKLLGCYPTNAYSHEYIIYIFCYTIFVSSLQVGRLGTRMAESADCNEWLIMWRNILCVIKFSLFCTHPNVRPVRTQRRWQSVDVDGDPPRTDSSMPVPVQVDALAACAAERLACNRCNWLGFVCAGAGGVSPDKRWAIRRRRSGRWRSGPTTVRRR